ncbi:hypothetical protein GCM10007938_33680 [Vibrio zhanjiangensis]|uniref:DNA-binding protein n=1 Tax=Vibrio zhanjiangensis TaxID=1046128 RepID=A0ABQ6F3W4_9VIBR|nr:hypothetical protein [Vibrio zhanjiangensis]GLT19586.1 hypothetical protein GCM10007938_33680 [Vibrio zhanjiangensis]
MTKDEFKRLYESKGWTPITLSKRWGYTAATRIHQIALEVECGHKRAQSYIDMLNGLPNLKNQKKIAP